MGIRTAQDHKNAMGRLRAMANDTFAESDNTLKAMRAEENSLRAFADSLKSKEMEIAQIQNMIAQVDAAINSAASDDDDDTGQARVQALVKRRNDLVYHLQKKEEEARSLEREIAIKKERIKAYQQQLDIIRRKMNEYWMMDETLQSSASELKKKDMQAQGVTDAMAMIRFGNSFSDASGVSGKDIQMCGEVEVECGRLKTELKKGITDIDNAIRSGEKEIHSYGRSR